MCLSKRQECKNIIKQRPPPPLLAPRSSQTWDGISHDIEDVFFFFFGHLLELTLAFVHVQVNLPPSPYILYK